MTFRRASTKPTLEKRRDMEGPEMTHHWWRRDDEIRWKGYKTTWMRKTMRGLGLFFFVRYLRYARAQNNYACKKFTRASVGRRPGEAARTRRHQPRFDRQAPMTHCLITGGHQKLLICFQSTHHASPCPPTGAALCDCCTSIYFSLPMDNSPFPHVVSIASFSHGSAHTSPGIFSDCQSDFCGLPDSAPWAFFGVGVVDDLVRSVLSPPGYFCLPHIDPPRTNVVATLLPFNLLYVGLALVMTRRGTNMPEPNLLVKFSNSPTFLLSSLLPPAIPSSGTWPEPCLFGLSLLLPWCRRRFKLGPNCLSSPVCRSNIASCNAKERPKPLGFCPLPNPARLRRRAFFRYFPHFCYNRPHTAPSTASPRGPCQNYNSIARYPRLVRPPDRPVRIARTKYPLEPWLGIIFLANGQSAVSAHPGMGVPYGGFLFPAWHPRACHPQLTTTL